MKPRIVILDDNLLIRKVLIERLHSFFQSRGLDIEIYTSDNGVEGLGYIYTLNPDVVIVDSTLPKYSGREVIDYLTSNDAIAADHRKLVILHEENSKRDLPSTFKVIYKGEAGFLNTLLSSVAEHLAFRGYEFEQKNNESLGYTLERSILTLANRSDLAFSKFTKTRVPVRLWHYFRWVLLQSGIGVLLFPYILKHGTGSHETVIEQRDKDLRQFRTKYYPTLATVAVSLLLVIFQVSLFVLGGFTIQWLGTTQLHLNSAFALGSGEKGFEFAEGEEDSFEYDEENFEFIGDYVRLKPQVQEVGDDSLDGNTTEDGVSQENEVEDGGQKDEGDAQPEPESIPQASLIQGVTAQEESDPAATPQQVLVDENGQPLSDANGNPIAQEEQATIRFPSTQPFLITKEAASYSGLNEIVERSSLNDDETSIMTAEENASHLETLTEEEQAQREGTNITYQLSPDGENFYYFNELEEWERTEQGAVSSNTIQKVNEHLSSYEDVFDSGKLYLKVFLHSNGEKTPTLDEIVVEKELGEVVSTTNLSETLPKPYQEEVVEAALTDLSPVVLNAAFSGGEKIVSGRLEMEDKAPFTLDVPTENLEVNVYYTEDRDITQTATSKGELIGTAQVQEVSANNQVQYLYELRTPSSPGGYVTAELVNQETYENSQLSKPVENATFTVNETGDQADASAGDGSCDHDVGTVGSQCTLRAAIQEANALAGADNIHFNIPTSDPGYVDYDTPGTPSSGDSTGGDDYWTIAPSTALPDITSEIHLDGATQGANQLDSNTAGSEVVINGSDTLNPILNVVSGADNSTIRGLTLQNALETGSHMNITTVDNVQVENMYVGLDAKGEVFDGSDYGIDVDAGTNIIIGGGSAQRNVLTGSITGVRFNNDTSGEISGNYLGLDATGVNEVGLNVTDLNYNYNVKGGGLFVRELEDSIVTLGGDTVDKRNYIAGEVQFTTVSSATDYLGRFELFNNYIGVNSQGEHVFAYLDFTGRAGNYLEDYAGSQYLVEFGRNGKGNLLMDIKSFGSPFSGNLANYPTLVEANSFLGDSTSPSVFVITGYAADSSTDLYNNYFGEGSDPYFNAENEMGSNYLPIQQNNIDVRGNVFEGLRIGTTPSRGNRNDYVANPEPSILTIGGTNAFTGSLCEGLEKNCFTRPETWFSSTAAIYTYFSHYPVNYSNIADMNNFNGYESSDRLLVVSTPVMFELFTGVNRRNNLNAANVSERIDDLDGITTYFGLGYQSNNCLEGSTTCPASGDTIGTDGETGLIPLFLAGVPQDERKLAEPVWYINIETLELTEEGITENVVYKYDAPHIAMAEPFSFDGDSTTHPLNTAVSRVINGYTYNDRGEPWTWNPAQARDITNGMYGSHQIAELEFVDANPVLNEETNEWEIEVNSTSDEDNVSLHGFDDGGGAYSGGGMEGPDGLSNGYTSLREAIHVANNFAEPVRIAFDIPETDDGYRDYDDPDTDGSGDSVDGDDYWIIEQQSIMKTIDSNIKISGESQASNQFDSNVSGPEIEIIGFADNNPLFSLSNNADDSQISNLSLQRGFSLIRLENEVDNIIINDNHLGLDALGLAAPYKLEQNSGVRAIDSSNLSIDNNLISGLSDTGVWISCDNLDKSHNIYIQRNIFGLGSDGTTPVPNNIGFKLNNGCFTTIGGEKTEDRNYFAYNTTSAVQSTFTINGNEGRLDIFNNIFGQDIEGNSAPSGTTPMILIAALFVDPDGYEVNVGGKEKGNLITNSLASPAILARPLEKLNISYNTFSNNSGDNINIMPFPPNPQYVEQGSINISNNFMANSDSDPYFNTMTTNNVDKNIVMLNASPGIITNNKIDGGNIGIAVEWNDGSAPEETKYVLHRNNSITNQSITAVDLAPLSGLEAGNRVTANDQGDLDNGSSNLQNYPVIEAATYIGGGEYVVSGYLDGNSSEAPFEIEVCLSEETSYGHGTCIEPLGITITEAAPATTEGASNYFPWQITVEVEGADGTEGSIFSSLATNSNNATSEFGANFGDTTILDYPIEITSLKDGQEINDKTPTFDWNANGDPDLSQWEIYLGSSQDNLQLYATIADPATTKYQVLENDLLEFGTYFWQVRDIRENGSIGGQSEVETFTLSSANAELTLEAPVDGSTIDERRPTFNWVEAGDDDISHYYIYLEPQTEGDRDVFNSDNFYAKVEHPVSELLAEEELDYGSYNWGVIAYYSDVEEYGRSDTASFTIARAEDLQTSGRLESYPIEFEGPSPDASPLTEETSNTNPLLTVAAALAGGIAAGTFFIILFGRRKRDRGKPDSTDTEVNLSSPN